MAYRLNCGTDSLWPRFYRYFGSRSLLGLHGSKLAITLRNPMIEL